MEERTQSKNIRSRSTRTNVEEALTRIIQKLKTLEKFPANGLIVFAGQSDETFIFETLEPPKKIFTYRYVCNNEFFLEPLRAMLESNDLVGVIAIDSEECGVGIIDGDHCYPIKTITSGIPGKSSKGGSSARRYELNRKAGLNGFFHRAADIANSIFLQYDKRLTKVLVAGPGFTKEDFLRKEYLDYRLRAKLAPTIGIEYAGADGIQQTFNISRISL